MGNGAFWGPLWTVFFEILCVLVKKMPVYFPVPRRVLFFLRVYAGLSLTRAPRPPDLGKSFVSPYQCMHAAGTGQMGSALTSSVRSYEAVMVETHPSPWTKC